MPKLPCCNIPGSIKKVKNRLYQGIALVMRFPEQRLNKESEAEGLMVGYVTG